MGVEATRLFCPNVATSPTGTGNLDAYAALPEDARKLWEDETQREVVIDCLKADCQVRRGRPAGL